MTRTVGTMINKLLLPRRTKILQTSDSFSIATDAVWHDHVRDELLSSGGGHAEEHRPAWVQTNHSRGTDPITESTKVHGQDRIKMHDTNMNQPQHVWISTWLLHHFLAAIKHLCPGSAVCPQSSHKVITCKSSPAFWSFHFSPLCAQLLMVVSIVLERNPELEFSDKVDLDGLVKEAFNDFQRDCSHFEGIEKQVGWLPYWLSC